VCKYSIIVNLLRSARLFVVLLLIAGIVPSARSQTAIGPAQPMITQSINEANLVVLAGNTRPEAQDPANDRGLVDDNLALPHMLLQLRRPSAQEQALDALIDQLHDRKSPNYHHWLNASELGAQFGPAASDRQAVTGWLQQHGFAVNTVYANGMVIDFSGTSGQVRAAFHTEIHNLSVNGVAHIANMSDPEIPAALAPAVVGITALHDFRPHGMRGHTPPGQVSEFTRGGGNYYVAPPDLATIYNFNPLFNSGITGAGQTIYVIEDTDLYSANDWTTFRNGFGLSLSAYPTASLTTIIPQPPSGPTNCTDPGVNTDDDEAILDTEYSSAGAPGAAIVVAACSDTNTTSGIVFAIQNLVNSVNPPSIMSVSYGFCEAYNGAAANAMLNTAYQTGVAEGMSIYVSAGDEGALSCTGHSTTPAPYGIGVDAYASTPYDVATGGTDFADTYLDENSTYWNSTNTATHGSAKSYIPEIPWNETCGSQLFADVKGFSTTYGASGFCNSNFIANNDFYLEGYAGSGGPSGCATGTPSVANVVSGTCAGYAKPSWQSGVFGIANDGVRDIPDVSLFAANAPWGHGYVICFSDLSNGGVTCDGTNSGWNYGWFGTSFTAPILAGVQALINQYTGETQGNPNYRLYALAAAEYGAGGSNACNSSNGNGVAGTCIFYDVTFGDDVVPCRPDGGTLYNCYRPSGTHGVMSLSDSSYEPAYPTATGWDFATGIGSINVRNLVVRWNGSASGSGSPTATHDFDGNGDSDVLWRNSGNQDVGGAAAIWLLNGSNILQSGGLGTIAAVWSIVGQRDFNGDGKADILWRNTSGNLAIWEMNGTTILNATDPAVGAVSVDWSVVGTGDFNGDGYGDILWRNTTTGDLAIWFMNGTAILNANSSGVGNVPTDWTVAGVGDFNGDGTADILWRNTSTGDLAIWEMNGTTVLNPGTSGVGAVPTTWSIVGTGDFNGDGKSDILWRDTAGDIAIWEMNGNAVLNPSTSGIGNLPTVWSVAETGDFDGDGKSDILWRDTSGDIAIWYMNGTTVSSGAGLGAISTTFTIQGTNAD
jgi:hypothetical protein